jgi:hypothetical protein
VSSAAHGCSSVEVDRTYENPGKVASLHRFLKVCVIVVFVLHAAELRIVPPRNSVILYV